MFRKVLIANRGEIVCRIARTCRKLGIEVATVHSSADRSAVHVREIGESVEIGAASASESYLNIEAILEAAQRVGADAIHPGIGFLSENPDFVSAVENAGFAFIGPRAETMQRFSDKWLAKEAAEAAGVPVIFGSRRSYDDPDDVECVVRELDLPVMLKAVAGGGGRGVRVIESLDGLAAHIQSAMREAGASFGRPDLIVEKFINSPRHVEVQIAGDGAGEVIHLFERECSLQRRFQKVIEEAPAADLSEDLASQIRTAATDLARSVRYRGLGTMEFLVSGDQFYFLECNPRIQVEHTVTEEITGVDLVELQLRLCADGRMPFAQDAVQVRGHSVQARIYAEDPQADFMPSTGRLDIVRFPSDARVDAGVAEGSVVTPYYDAMLAKIIVHGNDREQALGKLVNALTNTWLVGVQTNIEFLISLLRHPAVAKGMVDNRFVDRQLATFIEQGAPPPFLVAAAAARWIHNFAPSDLTDPWSAILGWTLAEGRDETAGQPLFTMSCLGAVYDIHLGETVKGRVRIAVDGQMIDFAESWLNECCASIAFGPTSVTVQIISRGKYVHTHSNLGAWSFEARSSLEVEARAAVLDGEMRAPMVGSVVRVNVAEGQPVKNGELLVVMESMKMELSIAAPFNGVVSKCARQPGDMVERDEIVVIVDPEVNEAAR